MLPSMPALVLTVLAATRANMEQCSCIRLVNTAVVLYDQELMPALRPPQIPSPYPHEASAEFFRNPEVLSAENMAPLKWTAPDEEGLVAFLVGEKSFNEDR